MASGTWNTGFWGQNQWNDSANPSPQVTGISLSATLGDESTAGEINAGWGRANWGDFAWGVAGNVVPTGIAATFNLGTVVVSADANATNSTNNNQTITAALNSVSIDIVGKVFPVGIAMTSALGSADASPDALATTNHATMALGSVQAYNQTGWGRQEWSENGWGVEGQFANVDVTGIAMTASVASVSMKGEVVVTLNTLNVANATLGQIDPAPDANLLSQLMTSNLGSLAGLAGATASPTGIAMTGALGTSAGVPGQTIVPTGIAMNNQLASVTPVIHIDVQVTGNALTMAQGSGNALIWNEVNTGTAPITPPGWQEVAA
ncbi:hypothetical protein [Hyphomonas sp.]|uniref:hypothetical protein n=1 Tax=Hyphomonas sp. TaxID=87 RepID=UPI000C95F7E9|nr:hypothetical protein [Hyphomonas sp.]MAL47065.1 hypothetical protein [Hyphomonas sp.]